MSKTVNFTSRTSGDPVRMLEVRCGSFQVQVKPDIIERGAGGDTQRSVQPRVMTVVSVNDADLRDLRGITWTEMSWFDAEQDRKVEHSLRSVEIQGSNLRCVLR